jgi:hypothetical protein
MAAIVAPLAAGADARPAATTAAVTAAAPDGFDSLLRPQTALADLYVGDRIVGQARIVYQAQTLRFDDVDAVVALVPDLLEPAAVRAALSADLATHSALVCPVGAVAGTDGCGGLQPAVAGVIFDEARFRVDLFVAPAQLTVRQAIARQYLPSPATSPSLINLVGGSIAGSGRRRAFAVQDHAVLSRGDLRLRSDLAYASGVGARTDTLLAELDRPGLRFAAGTMWVPGTELVGQHRLIGAGVRSQTDTRLDRNVIAGTPIVVFLRRRARVDMLYDGRLLASRTYEAGNQSIDTSALPDGSYDIDLHIQEAGDAVRNERRFFSRNALIAAAGEPLFAAYAGLLGDAAGGGTRRRSGSPFYQAALAWRLAPQVAVDATVMGTDRRALLQAGAYWLRPSAQWRAGLLASTAGDAGLLVQGNSTGAGRVQYRLDARRVWAGRGGTAGSVGTDVLGSPLYDVRGRTAPLAIGSFAQVDGAIGYQVGEMRLNLTGSYRRGARMSAYYAIGPSAFVPVFDRGGFRIGLRADLAGTSNGTTASVGISLLKLAARSSMTVNGGIRTRTGSQAGTGAFGDIAGSLTREDVLAGNLSLTGGVSRDDQRTVLRGEADLTTAAAAIALSAAGPVAGQDGPLQYGASFSTALGVGPRNLAVQARDQGESMIVVDVRGPADDTTYDVVVDDTPRATLRKGEKLSILLPPYRRYAVRLRPQGKVIEHLDTVTRSVSLYPGNVVPLTWIARPVVAMFGRLVDDDGAPLADVEISSPGAIGRTDAHGFFQIETDPDATLTLHLPNGTSCTHRLTVKPSPDDYAALGTLTCPRRPPPVFAPSR